VLSGQCFAQRGLARHCVKSDGTKGYESLRVFSPIFKNAQNHPTGIGNRDAEGVQVLRRSERIRLISVGWRDTRSACSVRPTMRRHRFDSLGTLNIHDGQDASGTRVCETRSAATWRAVNPQFDAVASTLATTR